MRSSYETSTRTEPRAEATAPSCCCKLLPSRFGSWCLGLRRGAARRHVRWLRDWTLSWDPRTSCLATSGSR
jgi:hypothetical protein